jgi:hypothetical protein
MKPRPGASPVSVEVVDLVEKETREFVRAAQKKGLSFALEIAEGGPRVRFDHYCLTNALRAILDTPSSSRARAASS